MSEVHSTTEASGMVPESAVPVVEIAGTAPAEPRPWLPDAADRELAAYIAARHAAQAAYPEGISARRKAIDNVVSRRIDQLFVGIAKHWLAVATGGMAVFVSGAFLGPMLAVTGHAQLSAFLMHLYRYFCAQTPTHSYYIWGHQMCLCQRCLAIYGSMFVAGPLFHLVRHRLRPLNWRLYLPLILPMAVDGFTQLFGWRTSTWELRTITGALFGISTVWLLYPYVEQHSRESLASPSGPALGRAVPRS